MRLPSPPSPTRLRLPRHAASGRAATDTAPASASEYVVPPEEADINAIVAERSRVRRGVASGELDPEVMHASNLSLERALSRLAPQ